jgi:ABC-type branched-subunit amino acid transport system permease subunit
VFCISAFLAGLGGALLAGVTQSAGGVASGPFGYFNSVALVAVLAFCGRRAVLSPVIAAFLFEVLKVYKPFSGSFSLKYEGVFFGILAVGVAVVPGITGLRPGRRAAERQGSSRVATRAELQSAREAWA